MPVLSTSFSAGNIPLRIVVFGVVPQVSHDVVSYRLDVSLFYQVAGRTLVHASWFFREHPVACGNCGSIPLPSCGPLVLKDIPYVFYYGMIYSECQGRPVDEGFC